MAYDHDGAARWTDNICLIQNTWNGLSARLDIAPIRVYLTFGGECIPGLLSIVAAGLPSARSELCSAV